MCRFKKITSLIVIKLIVRKPKFILLSLKSDDFKWESRVAELETKTTRAVGETCSPNTN